MSKKSETILLKSVLPPITRANRAGIREQALLVFLLAKPRELVVKRVARM